MTQSLQNRGRGFEPSGLNPASQSSLNRQEGFGEYHRDWSQPPGKIRLTSFLEIY